MLHIHRFERLWLSVGLAIPVVLLATITTSAIVEGFVPPSRVQTIAHIFAFDPQKIAVPAGSRVTFYVTSPDVEHGFSVARTGWDVPWSAMNIAAPVTSSWPAVSR